MLGMNLGQMAKDEFAKVDAKVEAQLHKMGKPSLPAIQAEIQEGLADIQELEKDITPDEMAFALNVLFPGKFTADKIAKGEAAINKVLSGLAHLQDAGAALKAVL